MSIGIDETETKNSLLVNRLLLIRDRTEELLKQVNSCDKGEYVMSDYLIKILTEIKELTE